MRRSGAVSTANIVHTPELLDRLLQEKPDCWPLAAFASVLFQRWAAVEDRRVQQVLATCPLTGKRLRSGRAVARFVAQHIRDVDELWRQLQGFMAEPSFMAVFGHQGDECTADGPGIVRIAHRLADFYVRLLEMAEECQSCSVPDQYAELIHECTQLMNLPLRDFGEFLDDVLASFRRASAAGDLGPT